MITHHVKESEADLNLKEAIHVGKDSPDDYCGLIVYDTINLNYCMFTRFKIDGLIHLQFICLENGNRLDGVYFENSNGELQRFIEYLNNSRFKLLPKNTKIEIYI